MVFRLLLRGMYLDPGTTYFVSGSHIGDMYAIAGLAQRLKKEHGIRKFGIISTGKLKKISEMFDGIDEYLIGNKHLLDLVTKVHMGALKTPRKVKVPGVNIALPGLLEKVTTFNNYNFWDVYMCQLGLEPKTSEKYFRLPDRLPEPSVEFLRFVKKTKEPKNSVFICPSSRAMRMTRELKEFIRSLIRLFKKAGLKVYLNDIPDYLQDLREEPAIETVTLPITDLIHIAELFGRIIVVRSGLADILTCAETKMVVVYAQEKTQHLFNKKPYIEYFTLEPFERRAKVLEVESVSENIQVVTNFLGT